MTKRARRIGTVVLAPAAALAAWAVIRLIGIDLVVITMRLLPTQLARRCGSRRSCTMSW